MHSSTKKYICKYCKVHGYTRSGDCKGHEDDCNMNPANKENPEAKHSASSRKKVTKKKKRSTSEINLWAQTSYC